MFRKFWSELKQLNTRIKAIEHQRFQLTTTKAKIHNMMLLLVQAMVLDLQVFSVLQVLLVILLTLATTKYVFNIRTV